jgi:hypothetical protein
VRFHGHPLPPVQDRVMKPAARFSLSARDAARPLAIAARACRVLLYTK